ncbi:hypothetical protein LI171_04900 [Emergencia timonensis]|uniref:hypothetical protein n=1 Tax=Emergencia timonensis TaxID=1776384 RepID=UPI001D05E054|nr:hypothetical protein [Emergencia timonensis]MCB6475576.1 hypothetical protein [Emergencia timonensis]
MKRPQSPCGGCKDRQLGCHAGCELYEKFKLEADTYRKIVKESSSYGETIEYSRTQLKRMGRI